jgi:hypothetical protein
VSLRPDGAYRCDRCDTKLTNGGVQEAAIISDLDPDDATTVRVLHLCRKSQPGAPNGCAARVLGPGVLAAYTASREGQ